MSRVKQAYSHARMMHDQDISNNLISAVRSGNLSEVRQSISTSDLSYSPTCAEEYVLLHDAIENKHTEINKLLLTNGSRDNSKIRKPIDTPLHSAVKNGNLEIVELLLDRGAEVQAKNKYGETPLHNAVESNKMEINIIESLLNSGANINAITLKNKTPLHLAVRKNNGEEIIKLLLNKGAHIDVTGEDAIFFLRIGVKRGYLQIIGYLLKHGIDINTPTCPEGYTPLHLAVKKRKEKIIEFLFSNGANVDAKGIYGITPLHIATRKGYSQIIENLLKYGVDVNSKYTSTFREGYTPLHVAAENGSKKIIDLLLSSGAVVNAKGEDGVTPLHLAVQNGHEKVVELLLENGANVDAQDREDKTILNLAVEKGRRVIIECVLKHSPDVNNKSNRNVLNNAVYGYKKEYETVIESLLEYGFTVNSEDVNNSKFVLAAVEKGYLQIVEKLLEYGTDVNMLCKSTYGEGCMPLHAATKNKLEAMTKLLINFGADVNAPDKYGNTPIFYAIANADLNIFNLLLTNKANVRDNPELLNTAVRKECKQIVEILLKYDVDVNARDKNGMTALLLICFKYIGQIYRSRHDDSDSYIKAKIVKLLLSRGADVNVQDEYGDTPIFYAIENADFKIFNLLLTNKANVRGNPELLNTAVKRECKQIVEILLVNDVDVNAKDKHGMTALLLTCFDKMGRLYVSHHDDTKSDVKVEIVKMLLSRGADVNARTKTGRTTIEAATLKGYANVVEALLEYNADVDSIVANNGTLLHIAAKEGYLKIVEILLKFGAFIDFKDIYGRTALHIASKEGCINIVTALLEHGSDVNITSNNYCTPLDSAMDGDRAFYEEFYRYKPDYNSNDACVSPCEKIVKILKYHLIKTKIANLCVNGRNSISFHSGGDDIDKENFTNGCEKELADLRNTKIGDSNTSFYDILTKYTNQLTILLKNEKMLQILRSNEYKMKFPIYASMINCHFRKAEKRKVLLDQVNKNCYSIFPNLPWECIQEVLSYLSDKDLKILIDTCKPF